MDFALVICMRMLVVYCMEFQFRLHTIVANLAMEATVGKHFSEDFTFGCSEHVVLTNLLDSSL